MTRKGYIDKLDRYFSKYIRLRDTKDGYGKCISCNGIYSFEKLDAGHFFSRRYMNTRWNENNVHAQCRNCNRFLEGNKYKFGKALEKKIGISEIDRLDYLKSQTKKYTISELKLLIDKYKQIIEEQDDY